MPALVVYESMFGNTRDVAASVALGLIDGGVEASAVEVGDAPGRLDDEHLELLVVGGPTHAFGMSRPGTRSDAAGRVDGEVVSKGPGIREWLETLPRSERDLVAATFDTRIRKPPVPGSAARAARRRLRRRGFRLLDRPRSFGVTDVQGPLAEGELERARAWGGELAARLVAPADGQPTAAAS